MPRCPDCGNVVEDFFEHVDGTCPDDDRPLPGPAWVKVAPNTFEHPGLLNYLNKPCQYTYPEAKTIQIGWDISSKTVDTFY